MAGEVGQRREPRHLAEPARERRARHVRGRGELRDRPRPIRVAVHEGHDAREVLVVHAVERAVAGAALAQPDADGLDDEDVAQPGENRLVAGVGPGGLDRHDLERRPDRGACLLVVRTHQQHVGQHADERLPGRVELRAAAEQQRAPAAAAVAQDAQVRRVGGRQVEHRPRRDVDGAGEPAAAAREDHEVSGAQRAWPAVVVQHARSLGDEVEARPEARGRSSVAPACGSPNCALGP
jgi:hypothetical protein